MKKVSFLLLLSLMVVLLAACGGEQAQPTATAEPAVQPAVEEAAVSPTADTPDPAMLTANTWQWVSFTDPLQQFEVEEPENYLLTFNDDGTVNIKADCSQGWAATPMMRAASLSRSGP